MNREFEGSLLSTVFVDYDNIYLSLKRKSEEAAVRFAKDAGRWVQAIASGRLITPTHGVAVTTPRRIVMNRCYGNPVPRRNTQDNATDMNSFPFVRHHYLRAGFEVIDCPPLTQQLKNSADIRMVMDVRDYLLHDTYFDEFIILSGDADFTPLLHRLRQHARRTVVYANDYTAAPYTAISDGEVRESDLIDLLLEGSAAPELGQTASSRPAAQKGLPSPDMLAESRKAIINEVLASVRSASQPVLLEQLADRAVRVLGHERTVGSAWGGAGSFRDLLAGALPAGLKLSDAAPYYVYDTSRQIAGASRPQTDDRPTHLRETGRTEPRFDSLPEGFNEIPLDRPAPLSVSHTSLQRAPMDHAQAPQHYLPMANQHASEPPDHHAQSARAPASREQHAPAPRQAPQQAHEPVRHQQQAPHAHEAGRMQPAAPESVESASALQQSIARIHEACQAPPLSPPEYRALFDIMAKEIEANGLTGARTLVNICDRAREIGIELRKDDARFILEVVSEADPWFEQGASANLFASRFRNFVVARCKRQGLKLTATELDLIEAWFTGPSQKGMAPRPSPTGAAPQGSSPAGAAPHSGSAPARGPSAAPAQHAPHASAAPRYAEPEYQAPQRQMATADAYWSNEPSRDYRSPERAPESRNPAPYGGGAAPRYNEYASQEPDEEFPRIVRGRLRG